MKDTTWVRTKDIKSLIERKKKKLLKLDLIDFPKKYL